MENAFYDIVFNVDRKSVSVSPTGPQRAGVYGDSNAAKVTFILSDTEQMVGHLFRIEIVDGGGGYDISELISAEQGNRVTHPIPTAWTSAGVAYLRLVEIVMGEDGSESVVAHYPPVCLFFEDREDGAALGEVHPTWQELMTRLELSVDGIAQSAEIAARAATEAQEAAEDAKHIASTVQKGDKGDKGDPGGSTDEEALDGILAIQEALIGGKVATNIDFVIEEGAAAVVCCNSSGNTTILTASAKYRKWNSGHLEVFGTFISPLITWSVSESGGMTSCVGSTSFPVLYFRDNESRNLFSSSIQCSTTGGCVDAGVVISNIPIGGQGGAYSDYGVLISYSCLVDRRGESRVGPVSIHAIGRWKEE